ncbi:hypothetical protein [Pseudoalteromonas sp. B160]
MRGFFSVLSLANILQYDGVLVAIMLGTDPRFKYLLDFAVIDY